MISDILKELEMVEKKEKKLLAKTPMKNTLKQSLYEKVPQGLCQTLETAFAKAFKLVFLKGTGVIEKTFDKESANLDYEAGNFVVDKAGSRKSIKRLDKNARKNNLLNNAATTVSGFGLGILGFGLPDIPLLVSTLLKGIYEIALGYGAEYASMEEKIYILRLIRTALAEGEDRNLYNNLLESMIPIDTPYGEVYDTSKGQNIEYRTEKHAMIYTQAVLEQEILATAKVLSDALLVEKFIQGIPIVGVVGGFVNHAAYSKIMSLSGIKYKKRYLYRKLAEKHRD